MRRDRRSLCCEGVSQLRQAILGLAVRDYEEALKRRAEGTYSVHSTKGLEEFFTSEYGQFLSGGKGEIIIQKCRDRVGDHLVLHIDSKGLTDGQRRRLEEDLTAFIAGRYPDAIVVRGGGHHR